MRRALPIFLALLATLLAGCGEDGEDSTRVRGDTLTIYASLPAHGLDASAGDDAAVGMRHALADAGRRAGGRSIRFVRMSSTRPGDRTWDPGTVEANADRAAGDPTTIAYLGELDRGASAVSLPVINREQILQVSPADALTSLTQTPPGRPRAGPERYYPGERETFVRLVPPDLVAARQIVAQLREQGTRRLAIVTGDGIADHELEAMVLGLIGTGQPRTITRVAAPSADDDPERVTELAEELVEADPQAIVYAADSEPRAHAALAVLATRLPGTTLIEGPALASRGPGTDGEAACAHPGVPAESALSRAARRRLETIRHQGGGDLGVEALLGYDAMRLTLAAIDSAGPDRLDVVRAAKALEARYQVCG
ncbi:MAG TPA: ABC transporter substrate-binding protein [Thermoleophilaceae bacterium]|nr:ABC transporter substrate-binding protein [Thermoleophilaceae bacterium]